MSAAECDNFQLKWHSFGQHLHSSIARLYCSDAFTDLTLATVDGHQVNAHRFVLSACSLYLNQLLRNTRAPNVVVVLPSEINYRTLRILVEYMYSGEATVNYGQLDNILKAAHILGVRGLCKEKQNGMPATLHFLAKASCRRLFDLRVFLFRRAALSPQTRVVSQACHQRSQ